MQKKFPWLMPAVFGFIGLLIFQSFIGLLIGVGIGYFFQRRQSESDIRNAELFQRQVNNLAEIIGILLRKTGNATRSNINDAKTLFGEEISRSFAHVDVHTAMQRLEDAATNSSYDESVSLNSLRNSLAMSVASRSGVYFLTIIIYVYCNAARTRGDDKFYDAMFTIGSALGIPPQIVAVLLMRATDYGNSQNAHGGYSWGQSDFGGGQYNQQDSYNRNYYRAADSQKELQAAYQTLGVTAEVTKDELRKAKRRLLAKWHPDKAPEGKKDEYTEMSQKINAAADLITAYKGF
ncbi:DnaJ domain-containing protein [Psittacicella gerlachiana]|uniref:J domain-containing protein n=1 Tax=Psittacicella gerlachiana TaxID=2028574 RepID=A0A3A1YIH5_9GAMM|nr:DnaJ domain-containing protein [Psittacicella gerlachiana]RIY37962.1 hypothetical protein CKF59_01060 [Psittacicella gerlachiana]